MLVTKGKSVYQYKSIREEDGGRKTLYEGKLSPQQIQEHDKRREEQILKKQSQQEIASLLDALDQFRAVNALLVRASVLCNRQYFRKGEVRTMRRVHDEY